MSYLPDTWYVKITIIKTAIAPVQMHSSINVIQWQGATLKKMITSNIALMKVALSSWWARYLARLGGVSPNNFVTSQR